MRALWAHPARALAGAFLAVVLLGTLLLLLPASRVDGAPADVLVAAFTTVSAVCVGQRVAHMVTGGLSDYLEFEDEFAIARCYAPAETWDRPLSESAIRTRHTITVVGVKRPGEPFTYAVPETVVHRGDELVLSGRIPDVERFTALADRP